jgi:hypothetical protein
LQNVDFGVNEPFGRVHASFDPNKGPRTSGSKTALYIKDPQPYFTVDMTYIFADASSLTPNQPLVCRAK